MEILPSQHLEMENKIMEKDDRTVKMKIKEMTKKYKKTS